MREPTCIWSKELSDLAVQTVLTLGKALILTGIPGQTFVYMTGTGKDAKPVGPEVSKKRIISVFNWIIAQTKGFKIPLLINFRHGDAINIGMGMMEALRPSLSCGLYELEKAGVHVPHVEFGWSNGHDTTFMLVSNLSRTQGKIDHSLDEIKTINIHGASQQPVRTILLAKIPS